MFDKIYKLVEKRVALEKSLNEKIRSKGFNWAQFKKISDASSSELSDSWEPVPDALLKYAQQNLEEIGEGSSRVVFVLSSRYALKIAKNKQGVAQNEAEVDAFTNPAIKPILAEVKDFDDNYRWLVSEIVRETQEADIEKMFGISEHALFSFMANHIHDARAHQPLIEELKRELLLSYEVSLDDAQAKKIVEFIMNVQGAVREGLVEGDMDVPHHWGMTASGRFVLLDYGLNEEVLRKFYD